MSRLRKRPAFRYAELYKDLPDRPRICQLSGGAASWLAARRVIDKYGKGNVLLVFADTLFESAGLYRFLDAAVVNLGARFIRLCEGRDPWQVFEDENFLGNSRADPCSRILKRELIDDWVSARWEVEDVVHYFGFDWTEEHRLEILRPYFAPARVVAPLSWPPYLSKAQIIDAARQAGLPISGLYEDGFDHDNCAGRCVKAGQAHYAKLLQLRPETYADVEARESKMRARLGNISILRDRTGGVTKPLPLDEFRLRVHAGQFDKLDYGACSCLMPPPIDEIIPYAPSV